MTTNLHILCSKGDLTITWDHKNADEREKARREVESLKAAGYSFFLVDGSPADEVTAGQGTLIVRKLTADEVVMPSPEETAEPVEPVEKAPKRRGRPPKADRSVVAVRPLAGG